MPYLRRPPGQVGFSRGRYGQAPAAPVVPTAPVTMEPQRVYKLTLPNDAEAASMISLDYIHALVRDGREDPLVRRKAYQILREYGVPERNYTAVIRAIHHWIQRNVRYEHDPAGVEFLTQARVLIDQVEHGEAFEDCDSFVLLEHALLNSIGVPTRSVIIAADSRAPSQWSHIFLQAYNNTTHQWVTLDPIMKNKPVGWHPPKFYRKKVVPIADGPPFPPRTEMGAPAPLPQGMTVEFLPTQPARSSVSQFYAGAVGGWHGFGDYGADFTEQRPTCSWPGDAKDAGPGPGGWDIWAESVAIRILRAHPDVKPQGREAASWVGNMETALRNALGPRPFSNQTQDHDFLFARTRLGDLQLWLSKHGEDQVADEIAAAKAHLEQCYQTQEDWQAWYRTNVLPKQKVQQLFKEIRELGRMRNEALSYVMPIIRSLEPLMPLAEHHMGRIKNRQTFLKSVDDVATWTGRVLSMLGPVTAGITEVIGVAIELGNMAYQMRQAQELASGSSAAVLKNIADAFDRGDELIRAAHEVADRANAKALAIQQLVDQVVTTHPEWAPTSAEEAQAAAAEAGRPFPVLPLLGAAAAVLIVAAVL